MNYPIYQRTYGMLLVLLALTVFAAYLPIQPFHFAAAMVFAAAKASLILAFFMHLKGAPGLFKAVATTTGTLLIVVMGLSLVDYFTRT